MQKRRLDAVSANHINRRKSGITPLSEAQAKLAQDLADRYELAYERAATYLDWYAAIHYQWITIEQATHETGQPLFV
jgi:hypothetical protein